MNMKYERIWLADSHNLMSDLMVLSSEKVNAAAGSSSFSTVIKVSGASRYLQLTAALTSTEINGQQSIICCFFSFSTSYLISHYNYFFQFISSGILFAATVFL